MSTKIRSTNSFIFSFLEDNPLIWDGIFSCTFQILVSHLLTGSVYPYLGLHDLGNSFLFSRLEMLTVLCLYFHIFWRYLFFYDPLHLSISHPSNPLLLSPIYGIMVVINYLYKVFSSLFNYLFYSVLLIPFNPRRRMEETEILPFLYQISPVHFILHLRS